jgi:sugar/nucleoside kinase (ribokinase family)
MSKLVIVGTVAFDAVETPYGKTDKILGGSASYIGLSASQFNVNSAIVSVVGGDFPQDYLDLFLGKGIDVSSIDRKSTRLNSSHRTRSRMPSSA